MLASEEQKKADENVLRLVEEQKVCDLAFKISINKFPSPPLPKKCSLCVWYDAHINFYIQREKEEALSKVLELERQLDAKQKLEMEIEELKGKLEVMKHLEDQNDDAVKQKMKDMADELQEKVENLDDVEELNNTLITKERESNDELQDARKEMISVNFLVILLNQCLPSTLN